MICQTWTICFDIKHWIAYRFDRAPVLIELKFINQTRGRWTWKFNNSLLKGAVFIEKEKQGIKDVIIEYECDSDEKVENHNTK